LYVAAGSNPNELISGHAFSTLATWNLDPRYTVKFEPDKVKDGDTFFINCAIHGLVKHLQKLPSNFKFVIIEHNCDHSFKKNVMDLLIPFAKRIYSMNNICGEECMPLMRNIPLGFCDSHAEGESSDAFSVTGGEHVHPDKAHSIFRKVAIQNQASPKQHLVFVNFKVSTNKKMRLPCQAAFKNQPWATFHESGLSPMETYDMTAKSKYVISPPGTGIDCHRVYEAIYLGAVPVVITSHLDYFYKNLPVVIVKDWNDVTEQYLNSHFEEDHKKLIEWKKRYINWTRPEFWISGGDGGPFSLL